MAKTVRKLARSEDDLHEVASRKTALDDFGDPAYREGLGVLLEAFDTDLQLNTNGWQVAYDGILRMLVARLYTQMGWAKHPEVLKIPIHRPLVIIGLPRTGSTALHRLLSLDSQFQGLETWLTEAPMIRPPGETWETHPAYQACTANFEAFYTRLPEVRKRHVYGAGEMEECTGILMQNFASHVWPVHYDVQTYARWFSSQNARESYHRYFDVLRLIGCRELHKRWLLKSPHHSAEVGALLEVFPDCCIIQTHRDPLKAIPSFCTGLHLVRRDLEGEAAPTVIGPQQCAHWRKALDQIQVARQSSAAQFFDVDHRRFLADPLGVVRSIYERFCLTLPMQTEQRMRAWTLANSESRKGNHQPSIDTWGFTAVQICEIFADYRDQYQFD